MCVFCLCVCCVQGVFVTWRAQGLRHKSEREQQGEASRRAGVCFACVCVQCVFVIWRAQGLRHKREREQQCEALNGTVVCVVFYIYVYVVCVVH